MQKPKLTEDSGVSKVRDQLRASVHDHKDQASPDCSAPAPVTRPFLAARNRMDNFKREKK